MEDNKYNRLFDTDQLKNDMKQRTIRGGLITATNQGIHFIFQVASTVILARLIIPEHFGLIGMVAALTVLIERFQDIGLGDAIVQKKKITHEQVSTLFWINSCICVLLSILVAISAKVVAWFYDDQRLVWITVAFACNFIFSGLAIQHKAIIRRRMRFDHFALINIIATASSLILAIVLAWLGYGYWALVWRQLAKSLIVVTLSWLLCPWRPGWPVRNAGITSMLIFGGNVTGYNILFYLSRNLDSILLGKFCGAVQVGLYTRAAQLTAVPATQLFEPAKNVSLPMLSALQGEHDTYRNYFNKMLSVLTFIYMPLIVYIGVYSDPLVYIALGSQWMDAVPIFRLLAVSFFVYPIVMLLGMLLLSSGQGRRYFYWGLVTNITTIICFILGIKWGVIGIATSWSISTAINFIYSLFYVFKRSPVKAPSIFKNTYRPALASIGMGLALFLSYDILSTFNLSIRMLLSILSSLVMYLAIWVIYPNGYSDVVKFVSYPLSLLKNKRMEKI